MLVVDVDNLKPYNARAGHLGGSAAPWILAEVAAHPFEGDRRRRLTTTIGGTMFFAEGREPLTLPNLADQRLHEAESCGRSRVSLPMGGDAPDVLHPHFRPTSS